MTIEDKLEQPEKVLPPIEVRPEPKVALARFEQPEKAELSSSVTLSGMTIEDKLEQSEKALPPIEVRPEPKVALARFEQPEKA